ncbi:Bifunctional inhibitor/plant lipid transfer protein/seed storage helical domain-containing protein [Artemisia annua]|uniref:Bifunctional inhibitor/plant lipid transfer protein/seed storage helical domain-containing protein n=1 Tax=Artemisia annua TaxID=35608 RepID=A0A2U1Q9P2_ARTAN|nr:Bifunctional inhibitor/plant lipid transfer protein/seed storage helical domain-containing protein [Artemisia annua]
MMMKVLCVMIACITMSVLYTAAQKITCSQVKQSYYPCLKFVEGRGSTSAAPPLCCDGLRAIVNAAKTPSNRFATCDCIKSYYQSDFRNITDTQLIGMDATCRVNFPYLSTTVDCHKYVQFITSLS